MKHYLKNVSCVASSLCFVSRIGIRAGAVAACLVASTALAATTTWTGSADATFWATPGNWNNGVPTVSGTAVIGVGGASVLYSSGSNPTLDLLTIDAAGGATLNQAINNLTSFIERVGDNATGSYVLSGGTNSADLITVGRGSTGTGTFTQSGGLVNLTTSGSIGQLIVGDASGSTGTYNLQGGSLLAKDVFVGVSGSNGGGRTFNQSGGTNTITNNLTLGGTAGGTTAYTAGSYNLQGGTNTVLNSANIYVGVSGAGTFTQDGGVNNITGGVAGTDRTLYVAAAFGGSSTSTGTYQLNNGSLNAETEYIGNPGTGTFNHVGGVNTVSTQLLVDTNGIYTQSGGQLTGLGTSGSYEGIYINTQGQFNLNGGVTTANGTGLINTGTFTMSSGGQLNGAGLKKNDVTGQFTATGGVIFASGTAGNAAAAEALADRFQNDGHMTITGSNVTTVNAVLVNSGTVNVTSTVTVFGKRVVNKGYFKRTFSSVTFKGGFSNGGTSIGDPDFGGDWETFGNGKEIALVGGDSLYRIGLGLYMTSTNNLGWDTTIGTLRFMNTDFAASNTTGNHEIEYAAADLGQSYDGYTNNFAWDTVIVDENNELLTVGTGALYTRELTLAGGISQLDDFTGDMTIYYDPQLSQNNYLAGGTYSFGSGSGKVAPVVAPVPEPSSIALMGVCTIVGAGVILRRKICRH